MKKYILLAFLSISSVSQASIDSLIKPISPIIIALIAGKSGYDFFYENKVLYQSKKYYDELFDKENRKIAKLQKEEIEKFNLNPVKRVFAKHLSLFIFQNCCCDIFLTKNDKPEDIKTESTIITINNNEAKNSKIEPIHLIKKSFFLIIVYSVLNYWHEANFKAAKEKTDALDKKSETQV